MLGTSHLVTRSVQIDELRAFLLLSLIGVVVLSVGLLLAFANPQAQLALFALAFGSAFVPTFFLLLDLARRAQGNMTVLHALGFRPAGLVLLLSGRVGALAAAGGAVGVVCTLSLLLVGQALTALLPLVGPTSPAFLVLLGYVALACVVGAVSGAGLGAQRAWRAFS